MDQRKNGLHLSRQTIRSLDAAQLASVVGGDHAVPNFRHVEQYSNACPETNGCLVSNNPNDCSYGFTN